MSLHLFESEYTEEVESKMKDILNEAAGPLARMIHGNIDLGANDTSARDAMTDYFWHRIQTHLKVLGKAE